MVSVGIDSINIVTGISGDGLHSMTPKDFKQWPTINNPDIQ